MSSDEEEGNKEPEFNVEEFNDAVVIDSSAWLQRKSIAQDALMNSASGASGVGADDGEDITDSDESDITTATATSAEYSESEYGDNTDTDFDALAFLEENRHLPITDILGDAGELTSKVEIFLSCSKLKRMDLFSKSDPMVIVYRWKGRGKDAAWSEIHRTEWIKDDDDPVFKKTVLLDYYFEESQPLRFEVYDVNATKLSKEGASTEEPANQTPEEMDFLGSVETYLARLLTDQSQFMTLPLMPKGHDLEKLRRREEVKAAMEKLKEEGALDDDVRLIQMAKPLEAEVDPFYVPPKSRGFLSLRAQEVADLRNYLRLKISLKNVSPPNPFASAIERGPRLVLLRDRPNSKQLSLMKKVKGVAKSRLEHGVLIQKLRRAKQWPEFSVSVNRFCGMRVDNPVLCQVSYGGVMEAEVTFRELVEKGQKEFPLYSTLKRKFLPKRFQKTKKECGTLVFETVQPYKDYTFLDYVKGGCQVNLLIAIDYSASNGDPDDIDSNHYLYDDERNQYLHAIDSAGKILSLYDTSNSYEVYGFGVQEINPDGSRHQSDCFVITGDPHKPTIEGFDNLKKAYKAILTSPRYEMSGPTCLAEVINEVSDQASGFVDQNNQQYFILMILTDGQIADFDDTKRAIIEASELPLSIVTVGIGDDDFSQWEALSPVKHLLKDDETGEMAERDILQFVRFRDWHLADHSTGSLARELLAKIPDQFKAYMNQHNIKPNKVLEFSDPSHHPEAAKQAVAFADGVNVLTGEVYDSGEGSSPEENRRGRDKGGMKSRNGGKNANPASRRNSNSRNSISDEPLFMAKLGGTPQRIQRHGGSSKYQTGDGHFSDDEGSCSTDDGEDGEESSDWDSEEGTGQVADVAKANREALQEKEELQKVSSVMKLMKWKSAGSRAKVPLANDDEEKVKEEEDAKGSTGTGPLTVDKSTIFDY